MDITTLPRNLIYRDRYSINEFGIYDSKNINKAISDVMLELPCIKYTSESEQYALMVFNNAYYICTMVLMEKDPRWRLNRYKELVTDRNRDITSLTLAIIGIYLSSKNITLNEHQKMMKDNLLKDIYKTESWYTIYTLLSEKIEGTIQPFSYEFTPRLIDERLFDEIKIIYSDWAQTTNYFNKQKIIDLIDNVGKTKEEKIALLEEINRKAKDFYNGDFYYKQTVIPVLDEIEEVINKEYDILGIKALDDCKREEYENLGDLRLLNERIQLLEEDIKSLQEQVESLSREKSDLVDEIKKKEQIIKDQKETIDELSVPAFEISAQQKVRMEMAWQLFEKAGLTQGILTKHGNKVKAAKLMSTLLDINLQKCAQYFSDRDLSKDRHMETISQLNNIAEILEMDLRL